MEYALFVVLEGTQVNPGFSCCFFLGKGNVYIKDRLRVKEKDHKDNTM